MFLFLRNELSHCSSGCPQTCSVPSARVQLWAIIPCTCVLAHRWDCPVTFYPPWLTQFLHRWGSRETRPILWIPTLNVFIVSIFGVEELFGNDALLAAWWSCRAYSKNSCVEIRVITSPTGWVLRAPKRGWPGEFKWIFGSLSFHWMQKFCSFPMHFASM